MNYTKAEKIFETSRKRKLTNNTYLEKNNDGSYAIRLHSTQVIKFYPKKTVLNSGGWRSVTTKARINEFTEFYLIQEKGIWYFLRNSLGYKTPRNEWVVFADGITYNHKTNKWTNAGTQPKKTIKLRSKAKQYAKDYVVALFAGKVGKPNGGDCWYCLMFNKAGMGNGDHIISHIKEKYYVSSLLVNATKMFSVSRAAEDCIARLWAGEEVAGCFADIGKQQIESSIRRYCYRQLQTA